MEKRRTITRVVDGIEMMPKCDPQIEPVMLAALASYRDDEIPAVILDEHGSILHGEQTLKEIKEYGAGLNCKVFYGVNRALFEAGDAPAFLETVRLFFREYQRPRERRPRERRCKVKP